MCTVSIITVASSDRRASALPAPALRIVCNRDESRSRVAAAAPRWRAIGDGPQRAIWPMDLEAGGTWIAASERGLCLCLLNLNPEESAALPRHPRSRGLVIPALIGSSSVEQAMQRLSRLPLDRFAPFRLVGIGPAGASARLAEARWDGRDLGVIHHAGPPACFVSSGLGDALVAPRLLLFDETVVGPGATVEQQDEFHRHAWPDRLEVSVLMSRAEARTVSITTVEMAVEAGGKAGVSMAYQPVLESDLARAPGPVDAV